MPLLSYPDRTLAATLSGGSWLAALPLTNLQNQLLSKKARSSNALAASSTILIDLGTARAVRVISLCAHNITASGTVRVYGSSTSGHTGDIADTTATLAWPSGFTATKVAEYPKNWTYCFTAAKTARYWKIVITDTGNSAGYIELGRCWMGEVFQPATGIAYGASLGYESRDISEESLGGVIWGEKRVPRRSTSITFPNITTAEKQTALIMQKTLGSISEIFYVMNELDTATDMLLQAFPATIRSASPLTYPYYNNNEMPMELLEIV